MKIINFLTLFLLTFLFFLGASKSLATSGCCSWHGGESYCDYSAMRWVCRDGTYSPSCTCGGYYVPQPIYYYQPIYVPPPAPKAPRMNASFNYKPNANQTYNVTMKWDHVSNTGFSLALHNIAGGDPGPLTDTTNDYFTFYNVAPGNYYADMKVGINDTWSTVTYWKVEVPDWTAPTPIPTVTPIAIDTSVNNQSFIGGFFDWLFGLFKSKDSSASDQATESPSYTCDCSKTCTQITTCAEAYYQLNTCGCSVRDGDGDGIPCENLCQ
jgi:hypothetical protein